MTLNPFKINRIWVKFALAITVTVMLTMSIINIVKWNHEKLQIDEKIKSMLDSELEVAAIATSDPLWNYNIEGIEALGNAVFSIREVEYLQVTDLRRGIMYEQTASENVNLDKLYIKSQKVFKENIYIGDIQMGVTDDYLFQDLQMATKARIFDMILQSFILILLMSLISLTVTQPLKRLEAVVQDISNGHYNKKIEIHSNDEVGKLAENFNTMVDHIDSTNSELLQMNNVLENLVEERTDQLIKTNEYLEQTLAEVEETQAELILKNEELEKTLDELHDTREELLRTAKTSLTSQLVAGVAHEINTPVGVSLTTSTFLRAEVEKLMKDYSLEKLTKKKFKEYLNALDEASHTIQRNLENSASLIEGFKQVAVDQTGHRMREFDLKDYINEILKNLHSAFKHTEHEVIIDCEEDIVLTSFPGAYSQIFTNLLMNSLDHGLHEIDKGIITIRILKQDKFLHINYHDNGRGIPEENLPYIFDAFFSTAHEKGGSGLGLSVISNLVTTVLGGTIQCESTLNKGTTFKIDVPIDPVVVEKK